LPTTAILRWIGDDDNAQPTVKVARCSTESPGPLLWFTPDLAALRPVQQRMIKDLRCRGTSRCTPDCGSFKTGRTRWPHPPALAAKFLALKSLDFPRQCFVATCDETFLRRDETIFRFWRRCPETAVRYQTDNKRRKRRHLNVETVRMRTISIILAFAFVLAGPSIAGVSNNGLPGVGTFSYNGFPVVPAAPRTILLAAN